MKYITEYDLRTRFHEQPFTDYQVEEGSRLTPGARQFLSDRGINLFEDGTKMRFGVPVEPFGSEKTVHQIASLPRKVKSTGESNTISMAKLISEMDVIKADFLVVTSEIIKEDIDTASILIRTSHEFESLKKVLTHGLTEAEIIFTDCGGMKQKDCCQDQGDCMELTDFYIQAPNGRAIVLLNALRAKVRALRARAVAELCTPEEETSLAALNCGMNKIINSLSQLICKAAGVKECKRSQ